MIDEAVKFGGSLFIILMLAWLAYRWNLGGDIRIRDEAHARELADDTICGFEAIDVALDRGRIGALLRSPNGQVMLIRRHGAKFAGRLLDGHIHTRLDRTQLTLATSEKHFGQITLDLGEAAQHWAASLRRIGG